MFSKKFLPYFLRNKNRVAEARHTRHQTSILIFLFVGYEEKRVQHERESFRNDDNRPYAVEFKRHRQNQHRAYGDIHNYALFHHVFEFVVILRAVVETCDGSDSDCVTHKHGGENETRLHNDSVCGHAVLACEFEKLYVVHHTDDRSHDVAQKFARTVGDGLEKNFGANVALPSRKRLLLGSAK